MSTDIYKSLKLFGFKSIIDSKSLSWDEFIRLLFCDNNKYREFGTIEIELDVAYPPENMFICTGKENDKSTEFINSILKIKDRFLSIFFKSVPEVHKRKLSYPIFIIKTIDNNKITGYYIQ